MHERIHACDKILHLHGQNVIGKKKLTVSKSTVYLYNFYYYTFVWYLFNNFSLFIMHDNAHVENYSCLTGLQKEKYYNLYIYILYKINCIIVILTTSL